MIRLENVSIRAGAFRMDGLNFEVPTGAYAALMGKTGSGKTTVLEVICGLKSVSGGRVFLMGRDVSELTPAERGVGYVPQDRALFLSMTVRENLAFALFIRRHDSEVIKKRVDEMARLLGVTHLLDRYPHKLSGGEAQRVALGRALAARPGILCLDEPLSALDDDTREEMYGVLESVQEYTGVTTLHVTHHVAEAERLADQIFVVNGGRIQVRQGK